MNALTQFMNNFHVTRFTFQFITGDIHPSESCAVWWRYDERFSKPSRGFISSMVIEKEIRKGDEPDAV
jgi:hypothetical protein